MPIFANKMRNSSPSADKTFPQPAKNQINDTKLCYRWQTIFACFYLTLFLYFCQSATGPFSTVMCYETFLSMTLYAMGLFNIRL